MQNSKKFLDKPENVASLVINVAIGGLIIYFWGQIVPFLLKAVTDTLYLTLVSIAVVAIFYIIADNKFRNMVFYIYRSIMRFIAGQFVNMDPIGIIRTYIEKAKKNSELLQEAINDTLGAKQALKSSIADGKKVIDEAAANINVLKKREPNEETMRLMTIQANQINRYTEMVEQQEGDLVKLETMGKILKRYKSICDSVILDKENDLGLRIKKRKNSRTFANGVKTAYGILKGNVDDNEMYELSKESLDADYAKQMGDVEGLIESTKDIVMTADLKDAVAIEKAFKKFDVWQNTANVEFGDTSKKAILIEAASNGSVVPVQKQAEKYF